VVALEDGSTVKFGALQATARQAGDYASDCASGDCAAARRRLDSASFPDVWDTAGQERYASLAPLYYRCGAPGVMRARALRALRNADATGLARLPALSGASAAAVVYDVTNMETFTVRRGAPRHVADASPRSESAAPGC